jgi:hypothetical protein
MKKNQKRPRSPNGTHKRGKCSRHQPTDQAAEDAASQHSTASTLSQMQNFAKSSVEATGAQCRNDNVITERVNSGGGDGTESESSMSDQNTELANNNELEDSPEESSNAELGEIPR